MPKRSATASPSWRVAGSWRTGASTRSQAFQVRGLGARRRRRGGRVARAPSRAGRSASHRSATTGTRSSCRSSRRRNCCLRDLIGGRRAARLAESRCARRWKTSSSRRSASRRARASTSAARRRREMSVIRAIAVSVFRESVRDKVLYNLVFFAVLLIGASYLLSQLTAGQDIKIIKDIGLAAMSLFGLFIAVFIGIGLVSKEVEKRSIYALLAKPIRRQEFVVGKYLGLRAHALREPVHHGRVLLRRPRRGCLDRRRLVPPALGRPCARSGAAESHRHDFSAARDRDGAGAVFFDLLEPDAVGGTDVRPLRRRATSMRT